MFVVQVAPTRASEHVYSVCEALAGLPRLNDSIVAIRAQFSGEVGDWLVDDSCKSNIVIGNHKFKNWISVDWPDSRLVQRDIKGKSIFPVDTVGRERLRNVLASAPSSTNLIITVEGLLMTRDPMSRLVNPRIPNNLWGYGHLGSAPARIVIKRILTIEKQ